VSVKKATAYERLKKAAAKKKEERRTIPQD